MPFLVAYLGATSPRLAGYSVSCGSSRRGSWTNDSGSESCCSRANGACCGTTVQSRVKPLNASTYIHTYSKDHSDTISLSSLKSSLRFPMVDDVVHLASSSCVEGADTRPPPRAIPELAMPAIAPEVYFNSLFFVLTFSGVKTAVETELVPSTHTPRFVVFCVPTLVHCLPRRQAIPSPGRLRSLGSPPAPRRHHA